MAGKVLLYGGTGGIGSATARALRARGFDLHLVARTEAKLATLADELNARFTVGDVIDHTLFARAVDEAGSPLVGLVYAIGDMHLGRLQRLGAAELSEHLYTHAVGAALAVQAAAPMFDTAERSASVVLFSSVAALQGFALHVSMGMAKGAVAGLMLSLAAELAPKVRVNAIAPSLTRTPLARGVLVNAQLEEGIAKQHALRRLGRPQDIASLSAFLISDESDWITGQIMAVDGGRSTLRTRT